MHVFIHTRTYIHTRIHTYIHKCTHTYIHTYIHIYIRTYLHTHIYRRTYIHIYIHTYINIYTYVHIYTHTYVHTYIHIYFSGSEYDETRGGLPDCLSSRFVTKITAFDNNSRSGSRVAMCLVTDGRHFNMCSAMMCMRLKPTVTGGRMPCEW
jgi:hypothetical protein